MKSCEKCIWCRVGSNDVKMFSCERKRESFNNSTIKAMFCKHFAKQKIVKKGVQQ